MIKSISKIICVISFCVLSLSVSAQIETGAKTGISFNQFSQPGTIIGTSLGIYGSYRINPFLSVKLEPQYSQEGGARPGYTRYYYEISNDIHSVDFINPSVRFHNLQIPVLVQATLPDLADESIAPVIIAGVSYAMTISAKEQHTKRYNFSGEYDPFGASPSLDVAYQRENVTDNYARNQWSAWFGMGLQFKTGERTCILDVRYRQGLNNLNLLRFASPGSEDFPVPGTGGKLRSTSVSINFSMSLFNF